MSSDIEQACIEAGIDPMLYFKFLATIYRQSWDDMDEDARGRVLRMMESNPAFAKAQVRMWMEKK